jgi:NAD(P)H-quinone oxidoreductase subunit 5
MTVFATQKKSAVTINDHYPFILNKLASYMLWLMFIGNLVYLLGFMPDTPEFLFKEYFKIDGFTILIWTVVTFFSAIISSYSENYLKGFEQHSKFVLLSFGFTMSVMFLVSSNHISLFIFSWLIMGFFMAKLIGVNSNWEDAKQASKFTQKYFLASTVLLSIGVILPAIQTQNYVLSELLISLDSLPNYIITISAICIIIAAIIQSAVFPFHRWLLSAMTAPTPASALMHAGFVNGSGILLAIFSTLIFVSDTYNILFLIGGLTAIVAQFTKLLQVNVKQRLACSTIAQMGFMIMQCGLGFFNAAVAHLILHGFYKAYLFLSAGESIEFTRPKKALKIKINLPQAIVVVLYGVLGAILFTALTGKGKALDSGIFLTLIVAITVGQMTYNIVKQDVLTFFQKIILPPVLFFSGIVIYALIFNGVTVAMANMSMVSNAIPLTPFQIIFGVLFLVGFFIMKLGIYRQVPWIYVRLLNASQPNKNTILNFK